MNKNIIIFALVALGLTIAVVAVFVIGTNPTVTPYAPATKVNSLSMEKESADLNNFDADLAFFTEGDIISQELDATLNEVGEISGTSASLTIEEDSLSSLNSDLDVLSGDETINTEIDQVLQETAL